MQFRLHGLIEDSLKNIVAPENITAEASWIQGHICDKFEANLATWECQHGIAHGILQHERVFLQQQALKKTLQGCGQSSVATGPCQNGIWMDYWVYHGMTLDMDFEHGNDPLTVCLDLDDSFPCLVYAPTAYLLRNPRQYTDTVKLFCRGGDKVCVQGVGKHVGLFSS